MLGIPWYKKRMKKKIVIKEYINSCKQSTNSNINNVHNKHKMRNITKHMQEELHIHKEWISEF